MKKIRVFLNITEISSEKCWDFLRGKKIPKPLKKKKKIL